jgi:hypothetical protein
MRLQRPVLRPAPHDRRDPVAGHGRIHRRRRTTLRRRVLPSLPSETDFCENYGHDLLTRGTVTQDQHRALAPAGRAILEAEHRTTPQEPTSEELPLPLTTGPCPSSTPGRRRDVPRRSTTPPLDRGSSCPPSNIQEPGLQEGDEVQLSNPRGSITTPLRGPRGRAGHGLRALPLRRPRESQPAHHDRVGPGLQAGALQDRGVPGRQAPLMPHLATYVGLLDHSASRCCATRCTPWPRGTRTSPTSTTSA